MSKRKLDIKREPFDSDNFFICWCFYFIVINLINIWYSPNLKVLYDEEVSIRLIYGLGVFTIVILSSLALAYITERVLATKYVEL